MTDEVSVKLEEDAVDGNCDVENCDMESIHLWHGICEFEEEDRVDYFYAEYCSEHFVEYCAKHSESHSEKTPRLSYIGKICRSEEEDSDD